MVYNPAFTGYGEGLNIMFISHNQWVDFKGSPQLNLFTLDKSFMDKKIGLGLGLISDKKGINNRVGGNLSYSYKVNINDDAHLTFGVSFGILDQTLDYSKVQVENVADPTVFTNSQHKITYDANAGALFVWKGFEFSAAVPQLPGNKISYSNSTNVRAYYTQARHYMGSLKYRFFVSEDKGISISPQGLIRFVANAPLQYDGNINFDWHNKFWVGATYKSDYAIAANAGFCIHKQFYIGYSYDIIVGSIGKYSGLSHEIMVNLKFGKSKKIAPESIVEEPVTDENKTEEEVADEKKADSLEVKVEKNAPVTETPKAKETSPVQVNTAPEELKIIPKTETILPVQKNGNENPVVVKHKQSVKESDKTVNNLTPVAMNNTFWIATNKAGDFADDTGNPSQKGYYVIVGSYHNGDFAKAEVKRLRREGFKEANWMYSESTRFNYVFVSKMSSKKEAVKQAEIAKTIGITYIWIQKLIE